ncbi:CRIB domain, Rho GTPase activation protein [Artemisia annua]|uniref:CRIB domain, Rho GTPase activation protein n=1 Tax=Artemisia annua TaxID=35608 RepID=A0A2U1QFW6_ARTAN|nr:CRIB domain, Rho GTPase activation protein [Artemisia annua]
MEIGWPTDVQHLTHVTFDRFHGFLGLPVEFEVEVPCKVPSARPYGRMGFPYAPYGWFQHSGRMFPQTIPACVVFGHGKSVTTGWDEHDIVPVPMVPIPKKTEGDSCIPNPVPKPQSVPLPKFEKKNKVQGCRPYGRMGFPYAPYGWFQHSGRMFPQTIPACVVFGHGKSVTTGCVSVFGVSAESMQCSYDSRGNSVPTILLLMQERLYAQGGLKAEGIFRINPENSHEEHVRDQLNRGNVPKDIEVHCLAGLIKAWFRELPCGILDGLSPDEVLNCNTEEERVELVKQLKPTETALLNWAVDLMSDVAEQEELNKMNARNIAMVFAPNMTQMSDPLTALMHAVQVMNLLKTLITKTLREREDTTTITREFSPTWGPQTDDEFSRHEEVQTSCELRQVSSEDEEDHEYTRDFNSGNETETLSEMEERFLKQIEKNKDAKDRFKKELELVTQSFSPTSGYDSKESETSMEIILFD